MKTLDDQIDQTTGMLRLCATFENRENELFAKQCVNARLLVEKKRGVTIAPAAVIRCNFQIT
jgi:multidrug efflux system membrane fusion protein